jgi:hypothetical protein
MLNPFDTASELHARVSEVLLKIKLSGVLDKDEMADLAYATGVQIAPDLPRAETRLQRLQRMLADAQCQAASDAAELESVQRIGRGLPKLPRFADTGCSQCGGSFGPGDHGYSHCKDHGGSRY